MSSLVPSWAVASGRHLADAELAGPADHTRGSGRQAAVLHGHLLDVVAVCLLPAFDVKGGGKTYRWAVDDRAAHVVHFTAALYRS